VLSARGTFLPLHEFQRVASASPARARRLSAIFIVIAIFLAGCARSSPSLTKAQTRAITGEIVAAARNLAGPESEVAIRPEVSQPGEPPVDNIYVSLDRPSDSVALAHALAGIARRHKLSIVEVSSGDVERFSLAYRGNRTQVIHVITPLVGRERAPASRGSETPKLAIILDDLGSDRAAAEAVLALPFPVTVSVLPHLPFSTEIAESAYRRGDQVLLHLPMQPQSGAFDSEQPELRVGMDARQVQSALAGMLATVPHAVGVNNHEGSRATADPRLMQELMPALRKRALFFVDSRTTPATVAYNAAERSGVPAASRKVFLDDSPTRDAILAQLDLAVRDAFRDGSAIAIGHPHPSTIAVLAEAIPSFAGRGIRLVFASDLVH
jgi:uncharacterized protein